MTIELTEEQAAYLERCLKALLDNLRNAVSDELSQDNFEEAGGLFLEMAKVSQLLDAICKKKDN